ncbi:MAG: hypothetical protein AUH91_00190 [Verrucomicrobia bacterium 13_1_40CM_4_54_4]|nr:MAG: hypothetical protein AUH91_00190 [Verrucomicrobia bacterium 13_1_40CM_4_54_4]
MKPICYGDRRDAELLLAASSDGLAINEINPVRLKTPAAPIVGSLTEELDIDIERILAAFHTLHSRVEHVLVEGVGGWMVPIRPDYFMSDLAVEMRLPICTHRAKYGSPQAALRRCRPEWCARGAR